MNILESLKKFTQPYADEDYDDYEDEMDDYEEEPQQSAARSGRRPSPFASTDSSDYTAPASSAAAAAPASGFSGQVLNMSASGKQEVVLFHAKAFDDAAKAADELRRRKAVILNMENVDKSLTRRVVDFLSGAVYALDGSVKKIAQCTYLFCPHNMAVVGDLEAIQANLESRV